MNLFKYKQTVVFTKFTIVKIIVVSRAGIQIRLMEDTKTHRYYLNLSRLTINLNYIMYLVSCGIFFYYRYVAASLIRTMP